MSWEIFKLSEVSKVVDSLHQTPKYSEAGYPMVRVTDVKGGYLSLENTYKVNQEVFSQFSKNHKPEQGDIIITRVGSYGLSSYVNTNSDFCLGQNTAVIIPKINNKFLYYVMSSHIAKNQIEALITGSSYKSISLGHIRNLEIPTPPLQTQKRIADILSAYDDLIENNLNRIKLLEQAAQNIYKEWFVNLRFPGYENTPINEETGLPEGWMKLTVEEYTKVASRGPSLNYKVDEGFPVLNQSCIRNGEIELDKVRIAAKLKENKEHCYLQINDILINSMGQGTLGRVSKNNSITEKFIIHNCITFLRSKDEYSQTLLYHFISSKENYFISISQGSTGQTTLKLSLIKEMEINAPSADLMKLFDNQVLPMWTQIGYLKNQNQKLKAARDILLPRLMNRTIEV